MHGDSPCKGVFVGQKTHPRGFRLGVIETWDSKWYHEKKYAEWLHEDLEIQKYIKDNLYRAGVSKIEIERYTDRCNVHVHTARPGIVIGRRGSEIEKLQKNLAKLVDKDIRIIVQEIRRPELDAQLVAEAVALQIERRTNYKQAMKKAVVATMRAGAEGTKIRVAGRLGGHEISRDEHIIEGRVPLHTLRARIDYGFAEANTKAGKIGVKVWIFKGEVIPTPEEDEKKPKETKRDTHPDGSSSPRYKSSQDHGRRRTSGYGSSMQGGRRNNRGRRSRKKQNQGGQSSSRRRPRD